MWGVFLGGHRKRAWPKRSPILGFPSIYAYTLCRRTTKFDAVKRVDFGFSHASHPKRAEFKRSPNFWDSAVFIPTRRTTKFGIVTYMGGTCF